MASPNAFSSWEVPLLELTEFDALAGDRKGLGRGQARYLISLSLLAPSTHNTIPQAYEIDEEGGRIAILLRRRHVLPASDPSGQLAVLSVGCALQNLMLAASQYGYVPRFELEGELSWAAVTHAEGDAHVRIGHVTLEPGGPVPEADARRAALRDLRDRKVVRAEFEPSAPLTPELRRSLEGAVDPEVRLHLFESERDKFAWGKLDELATKHKLEERAFRQELGRSLLPDDDTESPRGMRVREFGLEGSLAAELPAQLRGDLPMPGDQLAFMARAARVGLTSSSAVGVLSCGERSLAAAICAGRAYQRCALAAFRHGFAHAVHTAICEVPHARAMSEAVLLRNASPVMIFRLGRPIRAEHWLRPHSSRPPLEDVILE